MPNFQSFPNLEDRSEDSAASVADKLYRYVFNPDHIDGGPKANWFEQALDFTWENASDLAFRDSPRLSHVNRC